MTKVNALGKTTPETAFARIVTGAGDSCGQVVTAKFGMTFGKLARLASTMRACRFSIT